MKHFQGSESDRLLNLLMLCSLFILKWKFCTEIYHCQLCHTSYSSLIEEKITLRILQYLKLFKRNHNSRPTFTYHFLRLQSLVYLLNQHVTASSTIVTLRFDTNLL